LYTFQRRDAVFFSGAESWLTLGEGAVLVSLFQLAAGPRAELGPGYSIQISCFIGLKLIQHNPWGRSAFY
jgi:hypothetical protein